MRLLVLSALLCAAMAALPSASAQTLYVDDDAGTNGNGESWATAYRYLQDALHDADTNGGVSEIRVAQGIYKPDQSESGVVTPGDREATFSLLNGVALVGGYAGIGAPDPDLRDIDSNATTLSGDLAGDDIPTNGPDYTHNAENSYHVVTASRVDATPTISGFIITGGNANGSTRRGGGGMLVSEGSTVVSDCRFEDNWAEYGGGLAGAWQSTQTIVDTVFARNHATDIPDGAGGGMYTNGTNAVVARCTFTENASFSGGGMADVGHNLTLADCTFVSNSAIYSGGGASEDGYAAAIVRCTFADNTARFNELALGYGGGLYNTGWDTRIEDCLFLGNKAAGSGGGLCTRGNFTIAHSVFSGNQANSGGGLARGSDPAPAYGLVFNSVFSGNMAETGGGSYARGAYLNCIFWGNAALSDPQMYAHTYVYVQNSCVEGSWPGEGNISADPMFVDADGPDGIYGTLDDDLRLSAGSPCIDTGDDDVDTDVNSSGVQPLPPTDLDGNPRIVDCHVDMGPYEFQGENVLFGDFDDNCVIDLSDYAVMEVCLSLSGPGGDPIFQECRDIFDHDKDGDVDLMDFAAFARAFTGASP